MNAMTEAERAARLAEAGYNIRNLATADVEYDFITDVPPAIVVPEVLERIEQLADAPPPLEGLATQLYGPARYVFCTKGRSAELALASALLDARPGATVLTHRLFRTTRRSLEVNGARVIEQPSVTPGSADIDVAWLEDRLAAGGDIVYLEASNNSMGGWPLSLENMTEVRRLCTRHQVPLVLDATRLLSNVTALSMPLVEGSHRFVELADAFTVSCSKECMVPLGSLVGIREVELHRKVFDYAYEEGTYLGVPRLRLELAAGFRAVLDRPALLGDRRRRLELLAGELRRRDVRIVEPIGGHGVFVVIDEDLLPGQFGGHSLSGLLYRLTGIAAMVGKFPAAGGHLIRLGLTLGCFPEEQLRDIAERVRSFLARAREATPLVREPGDDIGARYFGRYMPA